MTSVRSTADGALAQTHWYIATAPLSTLHSQGDYSSCLHVCKGLQACSAIRLSEL